VVLTLVIASVTTLFIYSLRNLFVPEDRDDEAIRLAELRIRRHEATVEDRLRKLDALRAADLETLIKKKTTK
jgi:hypothetical protein